MASLRLQKAYSGWPVNWKWFSPRFHSICNESDPWIVCLGMLVIHPFLTTTTMWGLFAIQRPLCDKKLQLIDTNPHLQDIPPKDVISSTSLSDMFSNISMPHSNYIFLCVCFKHFFFSKAHAIYEMHLKSQLVSLVHHGQTWLSGTCFTCSKFFSFNYWHLQKMQIPKNSARLLSFNKTEAKTKRTETHVEISISSFETWFYAKFTRVSLFMYYSIYESSSSK